MLKGELYMSINTDYYQQIINDYPEYVTKEQFYKIAHISKKTAQYLLQSQKVPCVENDKKTRKYKIKVSDIVDYMIDRELRPGYYLPNRSKKVDSSHLSFLYCKMCSMNENEIKKFRSYISKELETMNDVLTVREISELIGISCKTISRKCTRGDIFSFLISGKRLIPKVVFVEYLSSHKGFLIVKKSSSYHFLVSDFFVNFKEI